MDRWQAARLASRLISQHGLHDWTFRFNRRKRGLGLCVYAPKRIELSIYFVVANDEPAVRDTILHEIAHALAGHKAGHGPAWRRKCVEVGAEPRRCGEATMPAGKWRATCPTCGEHFTRHHRPKHGRKYMCGKCGPQGALTFGLRAS